MRSAVLFFFFRPPHCVRLLFSLSVYERGRDRHRRSTVAPPEQRSLNVLPRVRAPRLPRSRVYVPAWQHAFVFALAEVTASRRCRFILPIKELSPPPFFSLPLLHYPSSYQRDSPLHSLWARSMEVYPRCYSTRTAAWLAGALGDPSNSHSGCWGVQHAVTPSWLRKYIIQDACDFVYVWRRARVRVHEPSWMYLSKLFFLL